MFLGIPVSCSNICKDLLQESGATNSVAEPSLSSRRQLAFSKTLGTNTGATVWSQFLICTRYDQIMNIFVKLTKYFSIYYVCKRSICEICHKFNNLYMKIMFCNLCFVYIFNKRHIILFTFIYGSWNLSYRFKTNCCSCKL